MSIKDGGSAFPTLDHNGHSLVLREWGISKRDWFAAHAPEPPESWLHMMRGVDRARNPHNDPHKPAPRDDFQLTAEWKYAHADAMIAAREGKS